MKILWQSWRMELKWKDTLTQGKGRETSRKLKLKIKELLKYINKIV